MIRRSGRFGLFLDRRGSRVFGHRCALWCRRRSGGFSLRLGSFGPFGSSYRSRYCVEYTCRRSVLPRLVNHALRVSAKRPGLTSSVLASFHTCEPSSLSTLQHRQKVDVMLLSILTVLRVEKDQLQLPVEFLRRRILLFPQRHLIVRCTHCTLLFHLQRYCQDTRAR